MFPFLFSPYFLSSLCDILRPHPKLSSYISSLGNKKKLKGRGGNISGKQWGNEEVRGGTLADRGRERGKDGKRWREGRLQCFSLQQFFLWAPRCLHVPHCSKTYPTTDADTALHRVCVCVCTRGQERHSSTDALSFCSNNAVLCPWSSLRHRSFSLSGVVQGRLKFVWKYSYLHFPLEWDEKMDINLMFL